MPPSNTASKNDTLVATWCDWMLHNKGRQPGTVDKYRGYLVRLAAHFPDRSLLELSDQELEVFAGGVSVKAGLSGRSRQAVVAAIRGFYRWARRSGHIAEDPAAGLPYPRVPQSLPLPISLANAEKLIWAPDPSTFKGLRDATLFALMIGCGMRLSGLVRLNEEDLVLDGRADDNRMLLRIQEKGGRERLVPVPREAQLLLYAYLGHPELEEIERRTPDGKVLFVSVTNTRVAPSEYKGERRRLSPRGIQKLIRHYGGKQGIPEDQLRPHAMRHLYGAELAEADVDLILRQALMGHADPKSTQIYSHVAVRKLIKVSDEANPLSRMRTRAGELIEAMGVSAGRGGASK